MRADEDDKEEIALLQSLRGGGPDSDGETAILGQSATRRHACDFNAHRLLPRLGDCAKGLAPPAGGEIVRGVRGAAAGRGWGVLVLRGGGEAGGDAEMVNALEQFSEPVSSDSDCPSGEDTMGPWEVRAAPWHHDALCSTLGVGTSRGGWRAGGSHDGRQMVGTP